ncbi:MAG TPA: DUF2079 domain-containing protein, partial [Roseiflexaceae bacterium]|nr:DUF2079 domain-containing protein [Roseiflexaceae bacterium]
MIHPARPSLRDPMLWIALAICAALLASLSIARYVGYNAGMLDLGNMAQAIGSVARGHPLIVTYPNGNASRLAGHVELIYLLLALPYAIWPDPRLLLVFQAVLFALGALPTYRLALRRTNSRYAARCLALIYLLYPTALTSVLFDLHGDTLALPLLMFALDALDARAWRRYAMWIALALSCKLYVAVAVVGLGLCIWRFDRQRRVGMWTCVAGAVYAAVAVLVVRPLFAAGGTAEASQNYLSYYYSQLSEIWPTLGDRVLSAIVVFGPALLIAWRGWRWVLPGLPIAAAALLSTGPGGAYDYRYHHYAVVVPFIVRAAIAGVEWRMAAAEARLRSQGARLRARRGRSWRGDLGLTLAIVLIFAALLVDTPLNPLFWVGLPGQGRDPSAYGILPRDAVKDRFLEQVPPGAPLAASNQIAPHLTNRDTLYLLRYPDEGEGPRRLPMHLGQVDYAIADALFDLYLPIEGGYGGGLDGDRAAIGLLLRDPQFGLVAERDGLLLFQRGAPAERALPQTLTLQPEDGAPAEQTFGKQIALVRHTISQVDRRRLRASFTWRLTGEFAQGERFVAVSQLDGVANARIVHLPTYAQLPSWQWPRDQLVVETFDLELPDDLVAGVYSWRLGWYNVGLPTSYATDSRSLLPGSTQVSLGTIAITISP